MATQDDYIRTALRVPQGLHAQIHKMAEANNRTFNAEILARLQSSFEERGNSPQSTVDRLPAQSQANGDLEASFGPLSSEPKSADLVERVIAALQDRGLVHTQGFVDQLVESIRTAVKK